ncbi:MAG: hypothetical protein KJZ87_00205 [Thermoguttaceae bacterium]|nr:hypothetical protein [Thermoguttaceae bacterium]
MMKSARCRCVSIRVSLIAGLLGCLCVQVIADGTEDPLALVRLAGECEEDSRRLEILKEVLTVSDLDPQLRADTERMTALVDRWIHDRSLYRWFDGEVRRTLDYDMGIAPESPLYPMACFYRGRMLVWIANEYGNIIGYSEERRRFFDRAVESFQIAHEAYPANRVIRMYLGHPFPPPQSYPDPGNAPPWAVAQREGLERLADIVHWWIDHRLREDGQYGGGWDDDCEMWRNWVPVMIAFEDPKITQAQAAFSEALLSQEYMKDGYTSHVYDVEHTAEPSKDTITPMMHLAPDDLAWEARARRIAELMATLWTGTNERGLRQFKSTYFSAREVDPSPKRACDTPYHVVAVQPTLLLWQRTGDQRLTELFASWMDAWVDAAAREEHGKPAGVVPAAIHWPDGQPRGPGENWWDPRHHGEPRLYEWPSAVGHLADTLLLTWHMTDDEKYLAPLRSMAAIRLKWLNSGRDKEPPAGSELWCGSKLGFLGATLAKYRLLTGSDEFDELLARDHSALAISASPDGRELLTAALRRTAGALAVNFPGYTSEVRFTDRVFAFPRLFGADMLFREAKAGMDQRPDTNLLYSSATGDRGSLEFFPLNAVRWLTRPREIAALVTRSGRDGFSAELFHFGCKARHMEAEFYLLAPGTYEVRLRDSNGDAIGSPQRLEVRGPRSRIAFELPPARLCRLEVDEANY